MFLCFCLMQLWLNWRKGTASHPLSSPQAQRCLFCILTAAQCHGFCQVFSLKWATQERKRSPASGESGVGKLQEEGKCQGQEPLPRGCCRPPPLSDPSHSTTLTTLGNRLSWPNQVANQLHLKQKLIKNNFSYSWMQAGTKQKVYRFISRLLT